MIEAADGIASVQGMPFLVPSAGQSSVSQRILATGATEPSFTKVIQRLVRPGTHVADVGANIGYFTCLMAQATGPGGGVVAFEPVERPREYLQHNVLQNEFDQVTVDKRALADWTGRGFLTLPAYRLQREVTGGERVAFEVEVGRLDDIIEQSAPQLDVIKVDIEGAELRALRGMRELLERWQPIVAVEVHPAFLELYGDSAHDLESFFSELNYAQAPVEARTDTGGNFHLVAGPEDALKRERLLPDGQAETAFSLGSNHEWSRGNHSSVGIRGNDCSLELTFDLADGAKEYLLTGSHEIEASPCPSQLYELSGDWYTELRWRAAIEERAACSLWLFEYSGHALVNKSSFSVTSGEGSVACVTDARTRTYRLGLRVTGAGTIRFDLLELLQWEPPGGSE